MRGAASTLGLLVVLRAKAFSTRLAIRIPLRIQRCLQRQVVRFWGVRLARLR